MENSERVLFLPCLVCKKPSTKRCLHCKLGWYCSSECRDYHWSDHCKTCLSSPPCLVCNFPSTGRCSRCKVASYCSTECRAKHWPYHCENCVSPPSIPIKGSTAMPANSNVSSSNTSRRRSISTSSLSESKGSMISDEPLYQRPVDAIDNDTRLELWNKPRQREPISPSSLLDSGTAHLHPINIINVPLEGESSQEIGETENLCAQRVKSGQQTRAEASSNKQLDEGGHKFKSPKSPNKDSPKSPKNKPLPNISKHKNISSPKLEKLPSLLKSPLEFVKNTADLFFPKSPKDKNLPKNPEPEQLSKSPEHESFYEIKNPKLDSELEAKFESHTFFQDIPSMTDVPSVSKGDVRKILMVSNGECLNSVFHNWSNVCFHAEDRYQPHNSNMPLFLPDRTGDKKELFKRDGPLTNVGRYQAFLLGESLRRGGVSIHHVFSAPSLRCVQTAHIILIGMGLSQCLKIRVEPKFFEYTQTEERFSQYMTKQELIKAGFNIDETYTSICGWEIPVVKSPEGAHRFDRRIGIVTKKLIQFDSIQDGGNILIVGDKSTVNACCWGLNFVYPRTDETLQAEIEKMQYCDFRYMKEKREYSIDWIPADRNFYTPKHLSNDVRNTLV